MNWRIFKGAFAASASAVCVAVIISVIIAQSSYSESGISMLTVYILAGSLPSLVLAAFFSLAAAYGVSKRLAGEIEKMGEDIKDISKNCRYEELQPFADKVQEQLDEKERLLNMKKRFTANVSHELKTPLTSISGYGEMLQGNMVKPEDVPQIGGIIYKESQRLINLTHDIIQLSQLEEYDYKPIIDYVDLMPVVNYCVDVLKFKAQKKNVEITVNGTDCKVKGTKSLIEELVYNLVENAIKYNVDGGKVTVDVSEEDSRVCLKVSDTGIGIPEKYLGRVFERFFRVDKSRSKATGGTGLGLAIVKHTAEYLGGGVSVKSKENEGTQITVILAK